MRPRLAQELGEVRTWYPDIEHVVSGGEDWFHLPRYPCPAGWRVGGKPVDFVEIAFKLTTAYPQGEPYGFATPASITFDGSTPSNAGAAVAPPFEGSWQQFSWAPDGWNPTDDIQRGSNLLAWVRSFAKRLQEGA